MSGGGGGFGAGCSVACAKAIAGNAKAKSAAATAPRMPAKIFNRITATTPIRGAIVRGQTEEFATECGVKL
jgi:hypothetical protein